MKQSDIDLRLLAGLPFDVEGINIYPKKLKDMAELGESLYHEYLGVLTLNPKDILKDSQEVISTLDVLRIFMLTSEDSFKVKIIRALKYFLSDNIQCVLDESTKTVAFCLNDKLINSEMYEKIKEVLIWQNCISVDKTEIVEEPDLSHLTEKQKKAYFELQNKIKKANKKAQDLKSKTNLTLADLISSYASYNNCIDIIKVWDLTVYQFYNQLKRIQLNSDYELTMQSMLHGADMKDITIKHFISKLDN